ncbi:Ribosomal protein S18 acetylase RimI and related acetyltransferases [Mycobacterium terramassiliense]|uniref:Ribosomal protein S18 acetylase RimI and related acetyltransferases n=1 Tax=Mycobacterium terramassiliense TaxID=1841859 RepID=A0A2U3N868_9MYCO|nr:Ribosomal protein S18 acetylase RimI and related acetyltransferases [Mycobacterium terramassiliense]
MESLTLATGSVDAGELAAVAAQTFPLACPPATAPEDIASFIDANLSAERFADYLADPDRAVITAARGGRIIGYAMLIRDATDDAAELSKIYVLAEHHGGGVSGALMELALATAEGWGARRVWLGVNQANQRAQRFYAKSGFTISGTRTFRVGSRTENDYLMVRELGSAPPAVTSPADTFFDSRPPASPR